jgi:signal transduction histidine kinase/ActR/RegA family two-component response regulator
MKRALEDKNYDLELSRSKLEKAMGALRKARDELELRVEERTTELRKTNEELKREIDERKKAEEEKKRLEAKLQQAQKLETMGVLTGGIAHNFNNLLMAVRGNVSLMLFDIDSTHPHYESLTTIKDEIEDGAQLTRQLLGYSRKGRYFPEPINLNGLVETTARSVDRARKEISVHRELAGDLFAIEADQSQIQQVLMNLFVNAADAMPGGGDLILKTANVIDKDMKGKVYDPKPGNYVQLTVTDTGSGMDKETQECIFDPFFTPKKLGHGTGLGLASVYGLIKGHGGYIDVDSDLGRGTTFTVYLPATDEKVEKTIEPAQQIVKGNGTILLVDDEDRVIDVGTKLLKKLGYTVFEARSGKEAIEIYKENKDKIALVFLDMVMPDVGGGEAYDRMKEINPNVKVLLSSGYDIDSEAKSILARGCDAFILKPFGMGEVSAKIREILDKK